MAITACLLGTIVLSEPFFDRLIELAEERYGDKAASTVVQWRATIQNAKNEPEPIKLIRINDFFNQNVGFSSDMLIWGRSDYWATPLETIGVAKGDCEDFSIAKYISLLKLGVPINKLRLVYVKAKLDNNITQAHMILAYYTSDNADPFILDNLTPEILPASKRKDLVPVFSFNSEGLWVGNIGESKVKKPETRLSRWREVLTRMQLEELQ